MYEAGKAYGFFSLQIFIQDLRRSQKRLIRYSVVLTIILCFFYLLYPMLSSGHLYDLILFKMCIRDRERTMNVIKSSL